MFVRSLMSCSTKPSPPVMLATCEAAYTNGDTWDNGSSSPEPEPDAFEVEDHDETYSDDFAATDDQILGGGENVPSQVNTTFFVVPIFFFVPKLPFYLTANTIRSLSLSSWINASSTYRTNM